MPANLLFLYGPSGSGKTRLLQMIDETLQGLQSVVRVGSEQLVDEMMQSVRTHGQYDDFFDRYAARTNLLVDNIWILRSRPAAASEMGRLIEARMAQGNLTVLASDLELQEVVRSLPAIGNCLKQKSAVQLNLIQADKESASCDVPVAETAEKQSKALNLNTAVHCHKKA